MSLFTGKKIIDLKEANSTNNYALNLLKEEKLFEGTVVRTFRQKQGRGQRHKHWESEDFCNLTFSVIFYPVFLSVSRQFQLSKAISLGVADFVKSRIRNEIVKIKWPNDIYIGDKKVAGILIENIVSSDKISSSVVGIGLNVNQTKFSADIPNPVSLKMVAGNNLDLEKCFEELCDSVEARYLQLKAENQKLIDDNYHSALYRLNEKREFIIDNKHTFAEITGVNVEGKLKLKTASKLVECGFHEIQFII